MLQCQDKAILRKFEFNLLFYNILILELSKDHFV
jgi:hypothetical protein